MFLEDYTASVSKVDIKVCVHESYESDLDKKEQSHILNAISYSQLTARMRAALVVAFFCSGITDGGGGIFFR